MTSPKILIRPETTIDHAAIREVNRLAFGGDAEANLVDALRDSGEIALSLIAELEGEIVGHILYSRLAIVTPSHTLSGLALAPMAVLPSHQRQGIGSQLVRESLDFLRTSSAQAVFVHGHPEFYKRFGFSAHLAKPFDSPFGGGDA